MKKLEDLTQKEIKQQAEFHLYNLMNGIEYSGDFGAETKEMADLIYKAIFSIPEH